MTTSFEGKNNKETVADIEYFLLEARAILNVRSDNEDAAGVLYTVLSTVSEFKKI